MPEPIETLFCCDGGYLQHTAVALASMLDNSRSQFRVTIVSPRPLPAELEDKLRRTVQTRRNLTSLTLKTFALPADLPANQRLAMETYIRLWIARFFPETIERVLYLDGDVVVLGDVAELWNMPLGENVVGATPIPGSDRWRLHATPEEHGYFNAGIMLFDLGAWRAGEYERKALEYIARHPERLLDADQDALNPCLHDRWLAWPYEWNVIAAFYKRSHPLGLEEAHIARILKNARILHFNGVDKPWLYGSTHPRAGEYRKYLRRTEWRDYVPPDRTLKNRAKKMARAVLPAGLVRLLAGGPFRP